MAKTDRQTDSTAKSTWWIVTAYDMTEKGGLNEMLRCEDKEHYPAYVSAVYGGPEKCPKTGRPHYQGAIQCVTQQRRSTIKQWLPTAHLEPARAKECIVHYCLKKDTAIGAKVMNENPNPYLKKKSHNT